MKSKMKKSLCIGAVTGIQVILSLLSFLEFIPCLGFDGVPSINIWFLKLTWWIKSELNRHVPCGTKTGEKINYFFYLFISFLHPVVGVSIEYSLLSLIFLNRLTFTLCLILFQFAQGSITITLCIVGDTQHNILHSQAFYIVQYIIYIFHLYVTYMYFEAHKYVGQMISKIWYPKKWQFGPVSKSNH